MLPSTNKFFFEKIDQYAYRLIEKFSTHLHYLPVTHAHEYLKDMDMSNE